MTDYKEKKRNKAYLEAKHLLVEYQKILQPFLSIVDLPTFIEVFNAQTSYHRRSNKKVFDSDQLLQNVTCEIAALLACLWWTETQQGGGAIMEQNLRHSSYIPHAVALLYVGAYSDVSLMQDYGLIRDTGNHLPHLTVVHYKEEQLQPMRKLSCSPPELMTQPFYYYQGYLARKLAQYKYDI